MSAVAVKLLILTVKTISKPFSKRLKDVAKDSESFKGYCIKIGNFMNGFTHNVNIRFIGGKQIKLKPLGETEAISRGAEVVGEGFVYGVSICLLVAEYARRDYIKDIEAAEKAEKKAQRREKKDKALAEKFEHLTHQISILESKLQELEEQNHKWGKIASLQVLQAREVGNSERKRTNTESKKIDNIEESKRTSTWWGSWYWPFYVEVIDPGLESTSSNDSDV
jgi:hypothetical protein